LSKKEVTKIKNPASSIKNQMKYSIIVPVYNRPEEVNELLESLVTQTIQNFEVIIVEDGSSVPCLEVVERYKSKLSILYFTKHNEGPGPARNYGYRQAHGEYFVAFDSDCIIPSEYFEAVEEALQTHNYDAWGGPDRAHENFSIRQRAMGYTMSSVFTTGGIRGGKKRVGWFQPRSFNMGISRNVFERTGGFKFSRLAEDIEFSIRMKKAGFHVGLIEKAYVFHKRRTTFFQFFQQVWNFGKGRAQIGAAHPEEVKITHWFPTAFTGGILVLVLLPLISLSLFRFGLTMFLFYLLLIFTDAFFVNGNLWVALCSIPSAVTQLVGYGLGFFKEQLKTYLKK
jgi:glycosyltransferase involved in cell wall biosynthesis